MSMLWDSLNRPRGCQDVSNGFWRGVCNATSATVDFTMRHSALIVGAATFVGCEAASVGIGTPGCIVAAGAAGGATHGVATCHGSTSCIAKNTLVGTAGAAVFAYTGGAGGGVLSTAFAGAAAGATTSATGQYLFTGHVDTGQVLKSAAIGGVTAGGLRAAGGLLSQVGGTTPEVVPSTGVTPGTVDLPGASTWGRPSTLTDHFVRHGPDFGAATEAEYAYQASQFFQEGLANGLPIKIDPKNGVIRMYDADSNTFGAYNANGTTATFYKPDPAQHGLASNQDYWNAQPGYSPGQP